jgi:peptidoglycan/xylan/chitin deacetylase (PgdA/CDA1 family)
MKSLPVQRCLRVIKNNMNNISLDLKIINKRKIVCMTLDLEQDYGDVLDEPDFEGLSQIENLKRIFKKNNLPLTCFVQGSLFHSHPQDIEQLKDLDIEFGVHTYSHPKPQTINHEFEITKGKEAFIKYFDKEPLGYRSPSGIFNETMLKLVSKNNFKYDSSVFPSFRPGGYFNSLKIPAEPYILDGENTIEFPVAVFSSALRIPITLSYVKLLGKPYINLMKTFQTPDLIVFDFHLHDLKTLNSSKSIPLNKYSPLYRSIFRKIYQNNQDQTAGLKLLEKLISLFSQKGYEFLKLSDVYEIIAGTRLN